MGDVIPIRQGHYTAHPKQARFLRLVLALKLKLVLALAGIRGGKTDAGAFAMCMSAVQRPCVDDEYFFIFSPTYRMSKAPVDKMFKVLYDKRIFPVCPLIRYAKSDRVFHLRAKGGVSRVMVMSLEDYDKIRGFRSVGGWWDEPDYSKKDAFPVVYGRHADTNAQLWLTTSPNGFDNISFEIYDAARKEEAAGVPLHERKHGVAHWESWDNPFISRAGLEDLAKQYDEKTYNQEVRALFVRSSGLMYGAFGRVNIAEGAIRSDLELWVGTDFNVNPMCSVIAQPFTTREGLEGAHILAERWAPDSNTYDLAKFLDQFVTERRIPIDRVTVYVDASGGARKTSAKKSDIQILRSAGFRVRARSVNPEVKDRVNCVNGLLRPRLLRYPRLVVDPRCVKTIESFEKQKWKDGVNPPEPDKTSGWDHLPDGVGYLCWGRWPLRPEASLGQRKAA